MENSEEEKIKKQESIPLYLNSQMNKEHFIFQYYKYRWKREGLDYTSYVCPIKSCNGSIKLSPVSGFYDNKIHTCDKLSASDIRILLFKQEITKQCATSRKTSNSIISSASEKLDDSERLSLPSIANLKRTIRNQQTKTHNFSYKNNYDIPEELLKTRSKKTFVHYDNFYVSEDRIIALWNEKILKEARKQTVFSFDGTFFACPKKFKQLFVGFYVKNYKFIPFVYFLLPDKKESTYKKALDILITQGKFIKMENVILDFELGMENAFREKFSKITIRSCLFHYTQAVLRKLKSLSLFKKYKDDGEYRFFIKKIMCCVFIPDDYKEKAFKAAKLEEGYDFEKANEKKVIFEKKVDGEEEFISKQTIEFLKYFYSNWIKNDSFCNDDLYWRVILNIPFTNNGAEGFNSALNKEIKNVHPSLVELLMVLRDKDYLNELNIYRNVKLSKCQEEKLERNHKIIKCFSTISENNLTDILIKICCLYKFSE